MVAETDPAASSADLFAPRAHALTARAARVLAYSMLAGSLVWWPVDAWLYQDHPELRTAVFELRLVLVAIAVAGLLVLRVLGEGSRWLKPFLALAMIGFMVAMGRACAGLDDRFFMAATALPLATIPLTVPRAERIALTIAISLAYFASYRWFAPEADRDTLGNAIGLLAFTSVLSVVFGHVFYETLRENHAQALLLDERAKKLEEIDALKNDFFANVSHELRTPLTLILGHLAALRREVTGEARDRVDTADRNAARLLVLIEELLELARLTGGRGAPKKSTVELSRLVTDVASNFTPSDADERGVELSLPTTLFVEADPRQLRTALHNLLSNAIKFTAPAQRRISVRARERGDEVEIEVEDNGIGIPANELTRVFERFYRIERGPARRRGGTGIGLALVHEIAEAHGGRVDVRSEPGKGSVFALVVPRGNPAASATPEPDESAALRRRARPIETEALARISRRGPRVVIAEDDPDLRRYVASVLARAYQVEAVADGAQALAMLRAGPADVLVTDVMMPGTSGLDLVRALRADPALTRLPVLFLTARVGAEARAEGYGAGADDFLTKPFDEEELLARVRNLLRLRENERALADSNDVLSRTVAERTADLRKLAERLEEAREEDRRHLAREIHDETGQLLTALRMELDLALELASGPELRESLDRMTGVLEQTLAATRALVAELRPRVLDDLGLGAAVEWFVGRFAVRSRLEFAYHIDPPDLTASPAVSTAIYRVLQESLTNVARHARARRIDVSLARRGDRLVLEVQDDGIGPGGAARSEGTGVIGMRERAEALGGTFALEPAPERGTRMRLVLPDASLSGAGRPSGRRDPQRAEPAPEEAT